MSAPRSLRYVDSLAAKALHNEACRRYARKPRKKPAPPAAWEQRRREYLEEVGRTEAVAPEATEQAKDERKEKI